MQRILPALRALLFASALVPLLVMGGCGLKGDLVLPEPGSPSTSQPESEEDAAGDDSENPGGSAA